MRRRRRDVRDAHGIERLLELRRDGASVETIATTLDDQGFRTPAGRRWDPTSVARLLSQRIRRSVGTAEGHLDARRPVRPTRGAIQIAPHFSWPFSHPDVSRPDVGDGGR